MATRTVIKDVEQMIQQDHYKDHLELPNRTDIQDKGRWTYIYRLKDYQQEYITDLEIHIDRWLTWKKHLEEIST